LRKGVPEHPFNEKHLERGTRQSFGQGAVAAEMKCIVENLFQDGDWAMLQWRDPKKPSAAAASSISATAKSPSSVASGTASHSRKRMG